MCLSSTQNESGIKMPNGELLSWKSAAELKITHSFRGTTEVYDGSGYQIEFPYTLTV